MKLLISDNERQAQRYITTYNLSQSLSDNIYDTAVRKHITNDYRQSDWKRVFQ